MSKLEWGTKRICPNCGARYYDMRRDPITCPKCGAPFDAESLVKSRKRAVAPAAVEEAAPLEEELEADLAAEPGEESEAVTEIPVGEEEEGGAEEEEEAKPAAAGQGKGRSKAGDKGGEKKEGEEEDEEVLEDASELGEDEDDMAEVIENVDEEDDR